MSGWWFWTAALVGNIVYLVAWIRLRHRWWPPLPVPRHTDRWLWNVQQADEELRAAGYVIETLEWRPKERAVWRHPDIPDRVIVIEAV